MPPLPRMLDTLAWRLGLRGHSLRWAAGILFAGAVVLGIFGHRSLHHKTIAIEAEQASLNVELQGLQNIAETRRVKSTKHLSAVPLSDAPDTVATLHSLLVRQDIEPDSLSFDKPARLSDSPGWRQSITMKFVAPYSAVQALLSELPVALTHAELASLKLTKAQMPEGLLACDLVLHVHYEDANAGESAAR